MNEEGRYEEDFAIVIENEEKKKEITESYNNDMNMAKRLSTNYRF